MSTSYSLFDFWSSLLVIFEGVVREISHWNTSLCASQSGNSLYMPQTSRKCYYYQYTMKSVGTSMYFYCLVSQFYWLKSCPCNMLCNAALNAMVCFVKWRIVPGVCKYSATLSCKSNRSKCTGLCGLFEQKRFIKVILCTSNLRF